MASGNPQRQKMINMMYLVLTALLALNVSADILKAFGLVNKGLGNTIASVDDKNALTMNQFAKLNEREPKAKQFYAQATDAQAKAKEVYEYIGKLKDDIAKVAGGWVDEKTKETVVNDGDTEIPHRFFLEEQKPNTRAKALREKLEKFENDMKQLVKDKDGKLAQGAIQTNIETGNEQKAKDGGKLDWGHFYFEGKPAIAAITLLTQFQTDIRSMEAEVMNWNISQVGASDMKFDNLMPIVQLSAPAVYQNGKLEAEVALGAYSSTSNPTIILNGRQLTVEKGKGKTTLPTGSLGEQSVSGQIVVTNTTTGDKQTIPFKTAYQVFTGGASISADKMNMLYIGLENPISVGVTGFKPEDVNVQCVGGNLKPVAGKKLAYTINPSAPGKVMIKVFAKTDQGSKLMREAEYRVRPVPKPEIMLGANPGPSISRGELSTVNVIAAGLGQAFAFEGINYQVQSFTFVHASKAGGTPYFATIQGGRVTPEMRQRFQSARPGDMIVISEVRCAGPGGTKLVNGVTFTVR